MSLGTQSEQGERFAERSLSTAATCRQQAFCFSKTFPRERFVSPICPQVQKKLGPAWTGRGRPPTGFFTKRLAEAWLRSTLDEARRGVLPGMIQTGATFADAAAEFLRYAEHDRGCKPSTLRDYRSNLEAHLLPAFGGSLWSRSPRRQSIGGVGR